MAARLIAAIETAIGMNQVEEFSKHLDALPLSEMTPEKQDFFLQRLLRQAGEKRASSEIHQTIYSKWIELNTDEENNPILPKIIYGGEVEELRVFLDNIGFNFYSCVISLSSYFYVPLLSDVLSKLDIIFGNQNYNIYKDLFEYLRPREDEMLIEPGLNLDTIASSLVDDNASSKLGQTEGYKVKSTFSDYIYEYLVEKMELNAPVAEKPEWILVEKTNYDLDDPNANIVTLLPNPEKAAEFIVDNMVNIDVLNVSDLTKAKVLLIEMYKNSPGVIVKLNLLLPVYIDLFIKPYDDPELIRTYGPLNPFIATSDAFSINSRMFECTQFEMGKLEILEEIEDIRSWFTENCKVCHKKIMSYHYAVRMPMPGGGWKGCYDSWRCVGKDLPKNVGEVEKDLNSRKIQGHLIRYFNSLLKEVGIYDREIIKENIEENIEESEQTKKERKRQMELSIFTKMEIPIF